MMLGIITNPTVFPMCMGVILYRPPGHHRHQCIPHVYGGDPNTGDLEELLD